MPWDQIKQSVMTMGRGSDGLGEALTEEEIDEVFGDIKALVTSNNDVVIEDFAKYLMNN
jgi:hypothetical protein